MELKLKELIENKGTTQQAIAKKLEISYPTMSKLCNGSASNIRFDVLEGLCSELDCTPNDIFGYAKTNTTSSNVSLVEESNDPYDSRINYLKAYEDALTSYFVEKMKTDKDIEKLYQGSKKNAESYWNYYLNKISEINSKKSDDE